MPNYHVSGIKFFLKEYFAIAWINSFDLQGVHAHKLDLISSPVWVIADADGRFLRVNGRFK